MDGLEKQAPTWSNKLDGQDAGSSHRARKRPNGGAKARFCHAVEEMHLPHAIRVDLKNHLFTLEIDEDRLARLKGLDGKLLLVTNVTDHKPRALVDRYHALADIERGFRVLKSEIEIGPIYNR